MANDLERISEQQAVIPLQRQWPQLGRELYTLERALAAHFMTCGHSLTEQEKMQRAERVRNRVFAQLYSDDEKYTPETRYRAYLLVKNGKAGEIVGNPNYIDTHGKEQELPYTGLEGYFAGSVRTSEYPGLTPDEVIQEESHIGVEVLKTIKKHAIERYTWASFAKMKKGLESGDPDVEDLRSIEILWAEIVRRLHVRIYDNQEFAMTITEQREQIEKLVSTTPARNEEEKAYNHFRDSTYAMLEDTGNSDYGIQVSDSKWTDATIIETIHIPKTQPRNDYEPIHVTLTPQQLEGYLFLTELGDIGGDPLARTVLRST